MPANYVFTYLHCLGSGCVGVMPADWKSWNPLCDVAKSQDVACVADAKPLPDHQEMESSEMPSEPFQGGEDCFFLFLSFLNSWSQVLWIQLNLIEEGDVWYEWISSRDLGHLAC